MREWETDLAGEDTAEGKEAALILCGNELGDIEHEGSVGVTVPDGCCIDVVQGSLIQILHPVLLGLGRRGQMPDHHFQQSLNVVKACKVAKLLSSSLCLQGLHVEGSNCKHNR